MCSLPPCICSGTKLLLVSAELRANTGLDLFTRLIRLELEVLRVMLDMVDILNVSSWLLSTFFLSCVPCNPFFVFAGPCNPFIILEKACLILQWSSFFVEQDPDLMAAFGNPEIMVTLQDGTVFYSNSSSPHLLCSTVP